MIIQIGGLLAKEAVWDNKFAKIMIIQVGGFLATRAVWDKKFVNDNNYPNWRPPCKEGGLGQEISRG